MGKDEIEYVMSQEVFETREALALMYIDYSEHLEKALRTIRDYTEPVPSERNKSYHYKELVRKLQQMADDALGNYPGFDYEAWKSKHADAGRAALGEAGE